MAHEHAVQRAAEIIKSGGIVAFPTETVYGLGADAFNPIAVARVFEVKKRPSFDPLIVHVADPADVKKLARGTSPQAEKLIERFWPGPLTIVLLKGKAIPDIVTAGLSSLAIRMPDHPMALDLIRKSQRPIAAPSANLFGHLSPTTAAHVRDQLGDQVDLILDGGPCPVGVESTIVSFLEEEPVLLRPGGVSLEEIESFIGRIGTSPLEGRTPSPGMLPKHYAPRTPIVLNWDDKYGDLYTRKKVGFLVLQEPEKDLGSHPIEILSKNGDLREAAANLFAALRRLDALNLGVIVAAPIPEIGLGRAIMDRLRRAASKGE